MPSGVYKRRPRPEAVREKIRRTLKAKSFSNRTGAKVYPWHRWFAPNRVRFTITKGIDFTCSIPSMLQSIRNRASERGIGVESEVEGKTITIRIVRKPKRNR